MKKSNRSTELSTKIVWVEDGDKQRVDKSGTRLIGIRFKEVDLSKPPNWSNETWNEIGLTVEPRSDLTKVLGQSITSKEEAGNIAYKIQSSEKMSFGGEVLELMSVEHDPDKNIWIFIYAENNIHIDGSTFHVAIDGTSGELIRMWLV